MGRKKITAWASAALLVLGGGCLSSPPQVRTSVIVQGDDVAALIALVESVGGERDERDLGGGGKLIRSDVPWRISRLAVHVVVELSAEVRSLVDRLGGGRRQMQVLGVLDDRDKLTRGDGDARAAAVRGQRGRLAAVENAEIQSVLAGG